MTIEMIKSQLGDFAKDAKLNLSTILTEEGAPDLSLKQIHITALASAYATRQKEVIEALEAETATTLSTVEKEAAKAAATIMAMNNIYYRFTHLASDQDYSKLPVKLRMNAIVNHGIDKMEFEVAALAVSAINGCGKCMDAHAHTITEGGISKVGVQSVIRIASVINSISQAVAIR